MSEETTVTITPPSSPPFLNVGTDNQDGHNAELYNRSLTFRWFVCIGEAKLEKIHLSDHSYLKNNEIHLFQYFENDNKPRSQFLERKIVTLFNNTFDFASVFLYNTEMLFQAARSEILFLEEAAKLKQIDLHMLSETHSNKDFMKARQHCVRLFLFLREYLGIINNRRYSWIVKHVIPTIEDCLNGFRLFLRRLSDLPNYVLHHCANAQGNQCTESSYHLFHAHLDMLWLHLTTVYLTERCRSVLADNITASQMSDSSVSPTVTLDRTILAAIADLVDLAVIKFEKMDERCLLIKSPYNCNCVAEAWRLLQILTNQLNEKGLCDNFWSFFNKVFEPFLSTGGRNLSKRNCRSLVLSVSRPCANVHAFALWFLKHTAMLHTYEENNSGSNHSLLEAIIKSLLTSDVSELQMRIYLSFVEKILIKYWEPKAETIIILWEYFQKRLNSTFYAPGASIDSIAMMSESVAGMVKQVKSRFSTQNTCDNSYQMFLRILGLYLQRVPGQQHWNQIRGRIYSKLSTSKVQGLNETGLYNLVTLFLTLAVTADLSEVSKKLQSLLVSLPESELDINVRRLIWRSHLSVCLLLAEQGHDLTPALNVLVSCLGQQQLDVSLYRTFFDGLRDILDAGPTLKVDHSMLVGDWIPRYLGLCSSSDSYRLIETLDRMMLTLLNQPLDYEIFQSSLWKHLSSYLRRRVVEEDPPLQLADISINLCFPQWETSREVIQLFLNSNTINISLMRRFLWKMVQNKELLEMLKSSAPGSLESYDVLLIKGWIRCSVLSLDFNSSDLSKLTNFITYLQCITEIRMDLPSSTDPLKHFIVALSNHFKAEKDICKRSNIRQYMSRVFVGMDKWIEPYVKQPKSPEQLSRIYHVVGLVFSLLPTFIYVKSRLNTVLKGLLDVLLLTPCAYKSGYEPNAQAKAVIAADIHLFINGLGDLVTMQDGYIERCIKDLIRIYLPLLVNHSQCKLHECVGRADDSVKLIFNTLCLSFIRRQCASPIPQCPQALKFILSVLRLYSRNHSVMLMLVDTCFQHICDIIMFCDDFHHTKSIARDVMVFIFESPCFGEELSAKIMEKFDNLCRDYLPFMPKNLFGLFLEVLKHRPELISRHLPTLKDHVSSVEVKRGSFHDHSLRLYVTNLEKELETIRRMP